MKAYQKLQTKQEVKETKAQLKEEVKQAPKKLSKENQRSILVGDDTGLLKKLNMTFSIEDLIISEPAAPKRRKRRPNAPEEDDGVDDEIRQEINKLEELPVVRHRPNIEFKVVSKSGEQVKDEGLKYLQWSLSNQTDYVSMVRGKSNIVQVFDTQTENTLFSKMYDISSPIKGLASIGSTVFDLKHVMVMENGKVIIDQA